VSAIGEMSNGAAKISREVLHFFPRHNESAFLTHKELAQLFGREPILQENVESLRIYVMRNHASSLNDLSTARTCAVHAAGQVNRANRSNMGFCPTSAEGTDIDMFPCSRMGDPTLTSHRANAEGLVCGRTAIDAGEHVGHFA
jgi:hypothetical protein